MAELVRLVAGTINSYPNDNGWRNIHLDKSDRALSGSRKPPELVADIANIPLGAQEVDEVRCWHTLEHLRRDDAVRAVAEFHRVLKPGGILDIEVPNVGRLCLAWCAQSFPFEDLLTNLYGDQIEMQDDDLNTHRFGYWEASLRKLLTEAGFKVGEDLLAPEGNLQLRFRAEKL